MSNDRPKPPKPAPQSEPTIRTAVPARQTIRASVDHVEAPPVRPAMQSDPAMRAARDADQLWRAVKELNEHKGEQANFNQAVAQHNTKIERKVISLEEINRQQSEVLRQQSEVLELQTRMLQTLLSAAGHPLTRKVAYGIGLLILAWLVSKGVKL